MAVDKDKKRLKNLEENQVKLRSELKPYVQKFIEKSEVAYGERLILTSGKRSAKDGVGSFSESSKHNTGEAFDLEHTQDDFFTWANNSKEGLNLMTNYGIGVYDETDPVNKEKTGATGDNFHFGIDGALAKRARERSNLMNEGQYIEPIFSYERRNSGEDFTDFSVESYNTKLSKASEPEEEKEGELTDDIINTMAEQLKAEEKLNKENSERLALIEADNAEKVKKAELQAEEDKLQGILAMYDTMGDEQLVQPQQEIAERQVDESPIRLNRASTENIFQSGYNG